MLMASEPRDDFRCGICQQVLVKPMQHTQCTTSMCKSCLDRYMHEHPNGEYTLHRCPFCRQPLANNTKSNSALAKLIKSTNFACVCGQTLSCKDYNSHSETCAGVQQAAQEAIQRSTVQSAVPIVNRSTFHCPLCQERNMDRAALLKHFGENHKRSSGVCPICAVMPWGDPNYVSSDLYGHMKLRHKFDYDTYTVPSTQDYAGQEEELLRKVIEDSLNQP